MTMTEAQKRAIYKWRETHKEQHSIISKIQSKRSYYSNIDYRLNKIAKECSKNYYNEDQILRCVRKLFN